MVQGGFDLLSEVILTSLTAITTEHKVPDQTGALYLAFCVRTGKNIKTGFEILLNNLKNKINPGIHFRRKNVR